MYAAAFPSDSQTFSVFRDLWPAWRPGLSCRDSMAKRALELPSKDNRASRERVSVRIPAAKGQDTTCFSCMRGKPRSQRTKQGPDPSMNAFWDGNASILKIERVNSPHLSRFIPYHFRVMKCALDIVGGTHLYVGLRPEPLAVQTRRTLGGTRGVDPFGASAYALQRSNLLET
jgi:hypothetical protein